jgi:hypothetical protein
MFELLRALHDARTHRAILATAARPDEEHTNQYEHPRPAHYVPFEL